MVGNLEIITLDLKTESEIKDNYFVKSYYGDNEILNTMFNSEILFETYISKYSRGISPKIKSIYRHKDLKKIYFEKIDGLNLSEVNLSKYSFKDKLLLYYKILNVFEKLHSIGVIHNDISLKNIMLSGDQIYIVDFSESLFLFGKNELKRYISYTEPYAAIEKYSKYNKSTFYTDIYSLTAIFYYIIFEKEIDVAYTNNIRSIKYKYKKIEKFLKRGLSSNYKQRFKNIVVMKNIIGSIIEEI